MSVYHLRGLLHRAQWNIPQGHFVLSLHHMPPADRTLPSRPRWVRSHLCYKSIWKRLERCHSHRTLWPERQNLSGQTEPKMKKLNRLARVCCEWTAFLEQNARAKKAEFKMELSVSEFIAWQDDIVQTVVLSLDLIETINNRINVEGKNNKDFLKGLQFNTRHNGTLFSD